MKIRIATISTAVVVGAASISSVIAFDRPTRYKDFSPYKVEATGSLNGYDSGFQRNSAFCAQRSAAEGNANQQNFSVKQYGQTAGGDRC